MEGSVPDATISVIHPWAGAVRGPAWTGGQPLYGIWFLSMNDSGTWDVLISRPSQGVRTVFGIFLPASSAPLSPPYAYPAGTPLLDALVYETAAGVQSASAQSPDADPEVLLGAFDSINTPAVQAMLATCLASSSPAFQAVGLAGSLERGVPGTIQQLVQLWPTISVDPHQADVVFALRNSWRDPTPAAVQQLASMTAAALPAYSDLRAAAIRALAAIHTKEALPFLATLLVSIDPGEQERAVYGLSSFANGCPMQTNGNVVSLAYLQCDQPSPYRTADTTANFGFRAGPPDQESALVSFWQTWWNNHPELH